MKKLWLVDSHHVYYDRLLSGGLAGILDGGHSRAVRPQGIAAIAPKRWRA